MKSILLFLLFAPCLIYAQLPANCSGTSARLAIAGDSWAQYMADDGTHNNVFKLYGHADKIAVAETYEVGILCTSSPGSNDYAVSGSEARQWADEANYDYLQNLIDALNANSNITHVLLSIGGNDILAGRSDGGWYKNMDMDTPGSEQALFDQVLADTEYIMDEVWARARPNITFIVSSYDFPNFNVTGSFLFQQYCDFYACPKREDLSRDDNGNGSIDAAELITDGELNQMMNDVEQLRRDLADANPAIFYDNGQGLMHYYYGFDDPGYPSFAAGTRPAPLGQTPYTPGGDVGIPTDRENFRTVEVCGIGSFPADPIHLDAEGYEFKIKNQFDNIIFDEFRGEPTATFFSEGAQDGYVDIIEETTNLNGIRVGDDGPFCCSGSADNDYRGIFSFNTASIPDDAVVTGASLYMIRSGADDNPFEKGDRSAVLDIKSGHFGTSSNLEWIDGNSAADATDVACFNGIAEQDRYVIRADLNTGFEFINKTGTTQLRMYFDVADWSVEYINFFDGGGLAAFLPPEIEALQNPPVYEYRIVKKQYEADGSVTEIEIERGPEINKREGYVYQEKTKNIKQTEEGDEIIKYATVVALEHSGLAKYMSDNYAAPGGGLAPFLDVKYELVLPAELLVFDAQKQGKTVLLNWETAREQNVDFFEVERSTDANQWAAVGQMKAVGDSEQIVDYQLVDARPVSGKNYYRLRQIDKDGQTALSEIRTVTFLEDEAAITVYPNPFHTQITADVRLQSAEKINWSISDLLGRVVVEETIVGAAGQQNLTFGGLENLPKGTYILSIFANGNIYRNKIVKD